jgi:hypothetical protein
MASPPAASAPAAALGAPSGLEIGLTELDALARGEAVDAPGSTATAGASPVNRGHPRPALSGAGPLPPVIPYAPAAKALVAAVAAYGRYFAAIAQSLVFLRKPGNIVTFVIVWLLLAMREVMQTAMSLAPSYIVGAFLFMASFVITGWYMAFRMNLALWAAGEEEELPGLAVEEGWWDGVLVPFFRMLAVYVFAFLPCGLFLWTLSIRMSAAVAASPGLLGPVGSPVPGASAIVVLVLLAALGLFIWPMLVLVVSCGNSIKGMFRLDLIGETILKSLPAYLLTVLGVYVAFGAQVGITALIWAQLGQTTSWYDDWVAIFGLPALLVGVNLYFDIVSMRAIGYYYCCFKHKFAWSWG